MPVFDWDSVGNRWVTDTLIDCNPAPVNNDDLCNKLYVDTVVGGAAIFMSMYATPQLAVVAAIASGVNAIFVDDVFTITVPVNLNSDGLAFIGLGEDTGFIVNDAAATGALTIPNANVVVQNLSIAVTNCVAAAEIITVAGARVRLEGIRMTFGAAVVAAAGVHLTGGTHHILHQISIDSTGGATVTDGIVIDAGSTDSLLDITTILGVNQNGLEISAHRTRIEEAHLDGCGQHNIALGAVTGCEIIGGTNLNAGDSGIHEEFVDATRRTLRVVGHYVENATNYGISTGNNADTYLFCSIVGCTFISIGQDCIKSLRGKVAGCHMDEFGRSGIRTGSTLQAIGNTFIATANTGPAIHINTGTSTHIIIGNYIQVTTNAAIEFAALAASIVSQNYITAWTTGIAVVTRGLGGVIDGNDIFVATGDGISINETGAASGHIIIKGNRVRAAAGRGIELLGSLSQCLIESNAIENPATEGIYLAAGIDSCVINNNDISQATDAIHLADCDDSIVKGNQIDACTSNGIQLAGTSTRDIISNNSISGTTAEPILIAGTRHSIVGNNMEGGTTGISLAAGADGCVIGNNVIYNMSADGIYLADCDYCAITGNNIDTAGDNGIELDGNSARNKVGDNVTRNCTTDGIFLDDTCDFNLVGLNQVPDGLTMGAGVNNEHYHNMV